MKQELMDEIEYLKNELDGARKAISRLSNQLNNSLESQGTLTLEVSGLKNQVDLLTEKLKGREQHGNSITRYE